MIGILTYYSPINYGAALQAYAMQQAIKEILPSKDVRIVSYCPEAVRHDYDLLKTNGVKPLIVSAWNLLDNYKRHKSFEGFVNSYMNTVTLEEAKNADCLVLGSDQIWNPLISRGFDPVFFGEIGSHKEQKIVSYAASIGISSLNEEQKTRIGELLKKVEFISVREEAARRILKPLTEKNITVDVDPTLLIRGDAWRAIEHRPPVRKPYVLVYSLSGYSITYDTAKKAADRMGAEIIEVSIKERKPFVKMDHEVLKWVSPAEFLGYIDQAAAVVTDSFHGTVFSILFHKSVYTIPNKTKGARMIELLNGLGLKSRIVEENQDLDWAQIDYEKVEPLLMKKAETSRQHLQAALINN